MARPIGDGYEIWWWLWWVDKDVFPREMKTLLFVQNLSNQRSKYRRQKFSNHHYLRERQQQTSSKFVLYELVDANLRVIFFFEVQHGTFCHFSFFYLRNNDDSHTTLSSSRRFWRRWQVEEDFEDDACYCIIQETRLESQQLCYFCAFGLVWLVLKVNHMITTF